MPTYVSLVHWTDQGIRNYNDSTRRLEDFTKLAESKGGRVRDALYTVGEYDMIFATKAFHSSALKVSIGPPGSFESRTATLPLRVRAISTQFAPLLL
jgi:uncharacterized protein with GYD domain